MAEPFYFAGKWYALYRDHQGFIRHQRLPRARSYREAREQAQAIQRQENRAGHSLRKHLKEHRAHG